MEKEPVQSPESVNHQLELTEFENSLAERLQQLSSEVPENYRDQLETMAGNIDHSRALNGEKAVTMARSEMNRKGQMDLREISGNSSGLESLTDISMEVKVRTRLGEIPTKENIHSAIDRYGIEKPYSTDDLLTDIQNGALRSKGEAFARLLQGENQNAAHRIVIERSETFLNDYKNHVAKQTVEMTRKNVQGDKIAPHEAEFKKVGTDTFNAQLNEKLTALEKVTSRRVARGIGRTLLKNLGVGDSAEQSESFSSKEAKESAVYSAFLELDDLIKGSRNSESDLRHKVNEKIEELGIANSNKINIESSMRNATEYALSQCTPEKIDALLDKFFVRHIIPELKEKGYKFASHSRQQQADQPNRESAKTQYDDEAIKDVEMDIRRLQKEGLSDSEIRKRLIRNYHPDVSDDPNAGEKIRYFNERMKK